MIHFKDQSEQLLEGAPTKSINIPPPENVFSYKAQNAAKPTHSEDQQVRNAWQWENCSGVTNTGKEGNGHCSHINSFSIR